MNLARGAIATLALLSLTAHAQVEAQQEAQAEAQQEQQAAAQPAPKSVPDPYADVDINLVRTEKVVLDIGGLGQVLGLAQSVEDPSQADLRIYLFLIAARLRFDGNYDRFSFNLQIGLGPEDLSTSSGISLGLLDLVFNISLTDDAKTYLKVGQFLVPYGREELTDPGFQVFGDRSMEYGGFVVGRDVGVAIVSHPGPFTLIGGVFTGGGRNVPADRYLPQQLGFPEIAARIGWGDVDDNPFYLRQVDLHLDRLKYQFAISGLYTRDSTIGHSTILNVKSVDKALLINGTWNPFIGQGAPANFSQGDYWQAGADAVVWTPLGDLWDLSAEAQADFSGYSNSYGSLYTWGARAQAGVVRLPFELALRYDVYGPSSQFSNSGTPITGTQPIQEIEPAVTWYIVGQKLKVIVDAPILINVPVFTEPNVGAYVGTQLPDQANLLGKGGSVARQTVPQAELMFQGQF
jgi:hypothetical protein